MRRFVTEAHIGQREITNELKILRLFFDLGRNELVFSAVRPPLYTEEQNVFPELT
jgi:hypothetical protein